MIADRIRLLERQARAGDEEARLRLAAEKARAGFGEEHRTLAFLRKLEDDKDVEWLDPDDYRHSAWRESTDPLQPTPLRIAEIASARVGSVVKVGRGAARTAALVVGSGPNGQNRYAMNTRGELVTLGCYPPVAYRSVTPDPGVQVQLRPVVLHVPQEWRKLAAGGRAERRRTEAERRRCDAKAEHGRLLVCKRGAAGWGIVDTREGTWLAVVYKTRRDALEAVRVWSA